MTIYSLLGAFLFSAYIVYDVHLLIARKYHMPQIVFVHQAALDLKHCRHADTSSRGELVGQPAIISLICTQVTLSTTTSGRLWFCIWTSSTCELPFRSLCVCVVMFRERMLLLSGLVDASDCASPAGFCTFFNCWAGHSGIDGPK